MKFRATILLLLLSIASAFGQNFFLQSLRKDGTTASLSYVDSIAISEIKVASSKQPTMVVTRTDSTVTLNAEAYLSSSPISTGVSYAWDLISVATGSSVATSSGSSFDISGLDLGFYDVKLTSYSLDTLERYFAHGIACIQPRFTAGEADLIIDLTEVRNSTWSNPLGNLTVTQGTNTIFEFNDVVRPGFKIGLVGDFVGRGTTWRGLQGTEAAPVQIQNLESDVNFTSTSDGVVMQFQSDNHYILLDGYGVTSTQEIKFTGRTTTGTQSQLLYFIGDFIKGISVTGCDFNQNRGNGATDGGASLQFGTTGTDGDADASCNGTFGDPGFWTAEYFNVFSNSFRRCWDECNYIGHFDDAIDASGYRPYRTGVVQVFFNAYDTTGRDFIQFASSDSSYIINNYAINGHFEASASHNSAISFNDGNRGESFVAFNYFEEIDVFTSAQNGNTGNGNYHFYQNFGLQRTTTLTNPNQFLFLNIENVIACHFEVINNTFISPDVNIAPVALQTDNPSTFYDANFKYAYNVMSTGGTDQSPYPELRRIGTPADDSGWLVTNTWERTADAGDLLLGANYHPVSKASPVFGSGADLSAYSLYAGNYDTDGFSNLVDRGGFGIDYSAGAFSGFELYVQPDITPPVFSETSAENILSTSADIHAVADEAIYLYYVGLSNGASAPTSAQVFAGQDASSSPAPFAGNTTGDGLAVTVDKNVTGLSASTPYDFYVVAVDADGNEQASPTLIEFTTLAAGVTFAEAGAGVSTGGSGDLTPSYPITGLAAGDLFILQATIRASAGTIGTPAGWTLIDSDQMGSSSNGIHSVFAMIATGSESGTVTVDFSTNSVAKTARIYRFTNNNTTLGSATESLANENLTNATVNDVGVTSTVSNAMAVNLVAIADDNTLGAFTGQTGGTWVDQGEYQFVATNGATIQLQTAELPSATTINGGTYTMSASDPWSVIGFVIKP